MISIVVPVFNEEESLVDFFRVLKHELHFLNRKSEILFIDDGSTDSTLELLKSFARKGKNIRIFSFRKNQGKAEALTYGFQKAKGEYIVTLDADLQDRPEEIKHLLKKEKEGWDVVSGWRKNRKDPIHKNISSKFFNFLTRIFWGLKLHDYNCGLKLYTAEAGKSLRLYGGLHRFIPLLVYQEGFTVTEIPVRHEQRKFGKSKFGFSKIWKDIPDMFTILFLSRYSKRPLHFFGSIGMAFLFIGILMLLYLTILHFQGYRISNRPLLIFGSLFVLGGFQIFFTGFLADLIINLSHKSLSGVTSDDSLLRYSKEK